MCFMTLPHFFKTLLDKTLMAVLKEQLHQRVPRLTYPLLRRHNFINQNKPSYLGVGAGRQGINAGNTEEQ